MVLFACIMSIDVFWENNSIRNGNNFISGNKNIAKILKWKCLVVYYNYAWLWMTKMTIQFIHSVWVFEWKISFKSNWRWSIRLSLSIFSSTAKESDDSISDWLNSMWSICRNFFPLISYWLGKIIHLG